VEWGWSDRRSEHGVSSEAAKASSAGLGPALPESADVIAAKQTIPMAAHRIAHDRFLVLPSATKAVDQVRRDEHRWLSRQVDKRFANTKCIWRTSREHLMDRQRSRFVAAHDADRRTGNACSCNEKPSDYGDYSTNQKARVEASEEIVYSTLLMILGVPDGEHWI
jgi:hypothetical protein